jgi:hypothetical protein
VLEYRSFTSVRDKLLQGLDSLNLDTVTK